MAEHPKDGAPDVFQDEHGNTRVVFNKGAVHVSNKADLGLNTHVPLDTGAVKVRGAGDVVPEVAGDGVMIRYDRRMNELRATSREMLGMKRSGPKHEKHDRWLKMRDEGMSHRDIAATVGPGTPVRTITDGISEALERRRRNR